MTLSARSRGFARLRRIAQLAFVLTVATVALVACENKHIGRRCDIGTDADAGVSNGTTATFNAQALECPTRICVLPGNATGNSTGPLCTADCSSDDDCSDGETTSNSTDPNHCKSSFVCRVVSETDPDFCCRKLCVCKDFLLPDDTGETPKACTSSPSTCKNVH